MFTKRTLLLILLSAFLLLAARFLFFYSQTRTPVKENLEGQVTSVPTIKKDKLIFYVGKVQVTSGYLNLNYGDKVRVSGEQQANKINATQVQIVPETGVQKVLLDMRLGLNKRVLQNFPQPQAALLSGILLGIKANLPKSFNQNLINTGTIHVVVVSGYNIALVGGFFLVLSPLIGRKKATTLALLSIVSYSLIVGASAPTIRALIMGIFAFSAVLLGRRTLALFNLILAAYLMILISPDTLFDLSFQLTVAATLGIILFNKFFLQEFKGLPNVLKESLASTLAAQVLVLPLLFYYFGTVSLISPLVNCLVLWTVPLSTVLGFAFLSLSYISQLLSGIISAILLMPLTFFTATVDFFGQNLNFLILKFVSANLIAVVGYYLLVLGVSLEVVIRKTNKNQK